MLNKAFALLFLLGVFFSCKNPEIQQDKIEDVTLEVKNFNLDRIVGTWQDSSTFKIINQTYVEVWEKIEDDTYKGIKYSIKSEKSGDTTFQAIDKSEGKFYFTIKEDGKTSTFMQSKNSKNQIEFANTKDEFPYNINYQVAENKLAITVSGNLNGIQKEIKFNTIKK